MGLKIERKEQPLNTAVGDEMQSLCGRISDELYMNVRLPLKLARTVLSDQQGQYFIEESVGECLTDMAFIADGYGNAYNRNEIIVENVREAYDALDKIIGRLNDFNQRLQRSWEVQS